MKMTKVTLEAAAVAVVLGGFGKQLTIVSTSMAVMATTKATVTMTTAMSALLQAPTAIGIRHPHQEEQEEQQHQQQQEQQQEQGQQQHQEWQEWQRCHYLWKYQRRQRCR